MPNNYKNGDIRGRFNGSGPVAIIDIGSNSVRLVVYERLSRSPSPLFNEKVLAGLGRGVGLNGEMDPLRVEVALKAISRFKAISKQVGVTMLRIVATAAVREANNGPAFISEVERICDTQVQILSGKGEAHYSAMGVVSGFQNPNGLIGDLGGGSLELVEISKEDVGHGITFPLGGLRLQDNSHRDIVQAQEIAKTVLQNAEWLSEAGAGKNFYAIGGTWRSLGRLHLFQEGYPLHVMQEYTIPAEVAVEFCDRVIRKQTNKLREIKVISKARRTLLPYGAAVLKEVVLQSKVDQVVFSALGIREGLLYDLLDQEERKKDALYEAAYEISALRSRSPKFGLELEAWTEGALLAAGIIESDRERRLRLAACHLADIGWRAHPDYRGEQSLNIISNGSFIQVDHPGRAYLAMSAFYRHEGLVDDAVSPQILSLCSERLQMLARIMGALLRIASLVSASTAGVLGRTSISFVDGKLALCLPEGLKDLDGERLNKRVKQLARIFDMKGAILIR
ncbi:Ppx/GppA family phosphatase [Flexibacterium corallicola]|uniref:Ppx/GppA family phosphatase n=1 Tax=Flexibacterium corallicola TaxID=3037259 RepID=UPI00286F7028|nr:Ppx/GppA phosphatase family protein [Pseudovibrio sp. M1P-2-3]